MNDINNKQYLQKIEKIQENIQKIKNQIEDSNQIYFIELVGTPKSGKTTLLKKLNELFEKSGIPITSRRETAEYNPVEKYSEQYGTWMIMELYKNLCEDIGSNHGKIVVYDRGILDRLPWIKQSIENGTMSREEAQIIFNMYDLQVGKSYYPIVYNFITSPELSIYRKGKEGKCVNKKSIANFNTHLKGSREFFKKRSSVYREFETDDYQDHLQEFIVDIVYSMTQDLENEIQKKFNQKSLEDDNCLGGM